MFKMLVGVATLFIGGLLVMILTGCVLTVLGFLMAEAAQNAQAAQDLGGELTKIDTHFNAGLSILTANLSTDSIFPAQVNKFTRETIQSGNENSPCGTHTPYGRATYETAKGTTIQIIYCLGTSSIPALNTIIMPVYCGDLAGQAHIRETVKTPYLYSTCAAAMFSSAQGFSGSIMWANGEGIFTLYGRTADEIVQFLRDYPY